MGELLSKYAELIRFILVVVLVSVCGYVAYSFGASNVQSKWDKAEAARAQYVLDLQQRYIAADAEATQLRAEKTKVAEKRVKEIQREVQYIPLRLECGHDATEHRMLLDAYCARNASDPLCVPQ